MRMVILAATMALAGCGDGRDAGGEPLEAQSTGAVVASPEVDGEPSPGASLTSNAAADPAATVDPETGLPVAVAVLLTKLQTCDRLRAQAGDYNADRNRLEVQIARNCAGTDAQLARLRREYAGNAAVQRALAEYRADAN